MLGKARRHAKRVGTIPVKVVFSIQVVCVILPASISTPSVREDVARHESLVLGSGGVTIPDGAELSVCFERGGKISSTSNLRVALAQLSNQLSARYTEVEPGATPVPRSDGSSSVEVDVHEKLELLATLYRDSKSGRLQDKSSKLVLRQRKKNAVFGVDTFKGLGLYQLPLHVLAGSLSADSPSMMSERTLPLQLLPGAAVKVIITTTLIAEGGATGAGRGADIGALDDTMSTVSGISDASESSTLAASFRHLRSTHSMHAAGAGAADSPHGTTDSGVDNDCEGLRKEGSAGEARGVNTRFICKPFASSPDMRRPPTCPSSPTSPFRATEVLGEGEEGEEDENDAVEENGNLDQTTQQPEGSSTAPLAPLLYPARLAPPTASGFSPRTERSSGVVSVSSLSSRSPGSSTITSQSIVPLSLYTSPHNPNHTYSPQRQQQQQQQQQHWQRPTVVEEAGSQEEATSPLPPWPAYSMQSMQSGQPGRGTTSSSVGRLRGLFSGSSRTGTAVSVASAGRSPSRSPAPSAAGATFGSGIFSFGSRVSSGGGSGSSGSHGKPGGRNCSSEVDHLHLQAGLRTRSASAPCWDDPSVAGGSAGMASGIGKLRPYGDIEDEIAMQMRCSDDSQDILPPPPPPGTGDGVRDGMRDQQVRPASADAAAARNSGHMHNNSGKRAKYNREAFELYNKELRQRAARVEALEARLESQAAQQQGQVQALRAELARTEQALRRERLARGGLAEATCKGDERLAGALSQARDEAETLRAQLEAAQEAARRAQERSAHLQEVAEWAASDRAQEMRVAQEAAAAAVQACLRRAELEEELEERVGELIDAKMHVAELALELEQARRNSLTLKARLQRYAGQVGALELRCARTGSGSGISTMGSCSSNYGGMPGPGAPNSGGSEGKVSSFRDDL